MGTERETKREKFVRLAEARTNKIIDMIRLIKYDLLFRCAAKHQRRMRWRVSAATSCNLSESFDKTGYYV